MSLRYKSFKSFRVLLAKVSFLLGALTVLNPTVGLSADISWSGLYRVEGVKLVNPELNGIEHRKAYMLHHLILSPKIVAADGLTLFGRFDILNDAGGQSDSQIGQVFGSGRSSSTTTTTKNGDDSNVLGRRQKSEQLQVTQVYGMWTQEFGALMAGRMPLQFGLGMTYSAGEGMFDHWYTTRDMVAYRMLAGNLSITPMIGKMYEGALGQEDDVNDYLLHIQYDNPETDLSLGFMFDTRVSTLGSDAPQGGELGGPVTTDPTKEKLDSWKSQQLSFFTSQKLQDFKVGVEVGLLTGKTGVNSDQGIVKLNSYGVGSEVGYANPKSKWSMLTKFGLISGDNPGTKDTYEGFIVDRNYNLGMLMFNHPLGKADFFRTASVRNVTNGVETQVDAEAISNVMYIAPSFEYRYSDKISFGSKLVWARLNTTPIQGSSMSKDLGFETDFSFTYKPLERFQWVTEVGMLFPGAAWGGGSNVDGSAVYENKFSYGMTTKAAIRF